MEHLLEMIVIILFKSFCLLCHMHATCINMSQSDFTGKYLQVAIQER